MLSQRDILERFERCGALLTGHFRLRSGLHSNRFFQAALALQHTQVAAELCGELADRVRVEGLEIDTVVSPAVGGIVVGQELGRALGCRAIFAEKTEDGGLTFRRMFRLSPGERVLVAEDVVTRGGRVQQTLELVREQGAIPVGVAVLVDRSGGDASFGVPFVRLATLDLETYKPDSCPMCADGSTAEKPGS